MMRSRSRAIGDQDFAERRALHRPAAHGAATENCMRCGCAARPRGKSPAPQLERCGCRAIDHAIVEHARAGGEYVDLAVEHTDDLRFIWSSFSLSTLATSDGGSSVTIAMVSAACSPPITAGLALGHEKQKRG